ncbi:hypothetical protein [Lactococcus cremoris]
MRYYVKLEREGLILQSVNVFGTLSEAEWCKMYFEKKGCKATIYHIELVPVEDGE